MDNQFFFKNLFAKLRFFEGSFMNGSTSPRHLLHVLKSLCKLCPQMLRERLLELMDLLCENMDNSIVEHDQKWALTVIEMITVLTEFID